MPVRIPTIDERKFQDLVDEALARVPVHNPEWTNFNKSDPGVTLIEVFAFLTESLLYRANLIPERNRLKFLSLLGVPLQPASAAQGLVAFANDKGPLAMHTLTRGVEVRAGAVPFVTGRGVDVLPIEAKAFYKADVTDLSAEAKGYYEDLYRSATEERSGAAARFYRTAPLETAGPSGVDLGGTVGHALWIALLARPKDDVEQARRLIAGKVLTLGWVPVVDDAGRAVTPMTGAGAASTARLLYEVPWIDENNRSVQTIGGLRTPQYRPLTASPSGNVLLDPGVVEVMLPPEGRFGMWDDVEPTEAGVGEFPPSLEDTTLDERLITWLRVRMVGSAAARVLWAGINTVPVSQRERVLNEALPDGTGEPDQAVTVARRPFLPGSVRLRVRAPTASAFEAWAAIDDLLAAGPEVPAPDPRLPPGRRQVTPAPSKVFVEDAEAGELRFGDGQRGARPPRGARLVVDYECSVGAAGNVGASAVSSAPALPAGVTVSNPVATWGGADAERVDDGEKQITRYLQHRDRLVTVADFEAITWRTPGVAIGRVDVLPSFRPVRGGEPITDAPGVVTVMVVPRFDPLHADAPEATSDFIDAVCAWLDPRRLVTTELILRGPEYVDVTVSIGIEAVPGASVHDVVEAVRLAVRDFLSPLPAPGVENIEKEVALLALPEPTFLQVRRGWPLRKSVLALEIMAVASRVPGVLLVKPVVLGRGAETTPAPSVDLVGLQLPRLAALSVLDGDPLPLSELRGGPTTSGDYLPVPVVPEVCG